MNGFGRLFKLALRRDRIKLPLLVLSLGLIFIPMAASINEVYPDDKSRVGYAQTAAASGVARAFNGPVTGATAGSLTITETFLFFSILVALVSTFLVIRHTRQDEEAGRTELVGSASVGHYTPLAVALTLAVLTSLAIGGFVAYGYILAGLETEGSLLAGLAMASVGITFASIAAFAAQLTTTSRAANGIAASVVGALFLVRAIGDVQGKVQPGGVDVISGWLSWLSPFGIARNTRPFADNEWWILAILAAIFITLVWATMLVLNRRDIGSGLLPEKRGRANARKNLLSSFGLSLRLQRGLFIGWFVGVLILALTFGASTQEAVSFQQDSDELKEIMAALGGSENFVKAYMAFSITFFGLMASAYTVQSLLRMRAEETSEHLELLLSTKVGRVSWAIGHIFWVILGASILLITSGTVAGLAYGVMANDLSNQLSTLAYAGLIYLPVVLVMAALVMTLFAFLPKLTVALAWLLFTASYMITQFAMLLDLPEWVKDLSPFTHIALYPAQVIYWQPLFIISGGALAVLLISLYVFKRRNLSTGA